MTQPTTTQAPALRSGDRIQVLADKALSAHTYNPLKRGFLMEVISARPDPLDATYEVYGFPLTSRGAHRSGAPTREVILTADAYTTPIRIGDTVRYTTSEHPVITATQQTDDGTVLADLLWASGTTGSGYNLVDLEHVARPTCEPPVQLCRRQHHAGPCDRCTEARALTLPHTGVQVPHTQLAVQAVQRGDTGYTAVLALHGGRVGTVEKPDDTVDPVYQPDPGSTLSQGALETFAGRCLDEHDIAPTVGELLELLVEEYTTASVIAEAAARREGVARYRSIWGDHHQALPHVPEATPDALQAVGRLVAPCTPHEHGVWQAWTTTQQWQVLPD